MPGLLDYLAANLPPATYNATLTTLKGAQTKYPSLRDLFEPETCRKLAA